MNEIITIESSQLLDLLNSIESAISEIDTLTESIKPTFMGESYITDSELSEQIHISKRKLCQLRSNGEIEYIQLGAGKVIYPESAISKLLSKHHHKAWA